MDLSIRKADDKKVSVMVVISRFDKCGPNRELYSIIRQMKTEQFQVYILTLFCEGQDSDIQTFKEIGVNIKQANISSNRRFANIRNAIRKWNCKWNPDIVYSSGLSACYHVAKTITDKTLYCTLHNNAYFDLKIGFGSILGKIGEYLTNYYVKNMDYNICCSKTLQEIYQKRFPNRVMYCIQNGTNIQKFQIENSIESIERRKRKLHVEGKIVFIVSGSLDTRKDPLTIIRAFKKLNLQDRAVLVFVGTGSLERECRALAGQNNIIFTGFVDGVEKYYQIADVYISASQSEGLPNSVLEAGACGCRMILSDILQHKEIYEENWENVSYFETGNAEALAQLIRKNVRHTSLEEKEKMREHICLKFSDEQMAKKYCDFFRKTVNGENL
ncbi:MAG: glycosyltransferase family 4 protein [Lachnospiraceae bacterium]|nr:glycosyltransferase family 4 protein [Lachnospiraceae bacterium]